MEPLHDEAIKAIAIGAASLFHINRNTPKNLGIFMEMLQDYGILVDVIDDKEWLKVTDAGCINRTILIPNSLYQQICMSDKKAIFIFFHELGHLLLGHQAMLHHSDLEPTKFEDAEWQADEFSRYILEIMKINYIPEQLSFSFEF
ncbi:MAG: ImmA/IrrE family metallo-endopeptidase [Neisseria sp.]|nr:ImmA/IrrE family metallo-endopeptidase [Neisseria sp.]